MKHTITLMLFIQSPFCNAEESICYGTTSNGSLKNGVKLPPKGNNFTSYSFLASMIGRTYVHSKVRDIILAAYSDLEQTQPSKVYKYAETGFKEGGQFKPHKTHRNGLSVDFMVPVLNNEGQSTHLPTTPLNKLGYNIEFDASGAYKEFRIDFEAMAAHIVALHQASLNSGNNIWRVIFDPDLQPKLFDTAYGKYLKSNIEFSKRRSWVRHDEHYHIDFEVQCQ